MPRAGTNKLILDLQPVVNSVCMKRLIAKRCRPPAVYAEDQASGKN